MAKPPLSVVDPAGTGTAAAPTGNAPPRKLGEHGMALWRSVTAEYRVADVAGREILAGACVMLDRAEQLAAVIGEDGAVIRTRNGPRAHPAVKEELAARSFVTRSLIRLGINDQPVHVSPGRPPGQRHGY
jgi:hypothetical protein